MGDSCNGTNEMHRQVEWMTAADVRILEFLHAARDVRGNPSVQSPRTIAKNTGYERKYAGQRTRNLVEHDLVEKVDTGFYRLTDRGERLMAGDLRPADL